MKKSWSIRFSNISFYVINIQYEIPYSLSYITCLCVSIDFFPFECHISVRPKILLLSQSGKVILNDMLKTDQVQITTEMAKRGRFP